MQVSPDLFSQAPDQRLAEAFITNCAARTYPVVRDYKNDLSTLRDRPNADPAGAVAGKGMLHAVRDEFVCNQPEGDCDVDPQMDVIRFASEFDLPSAQFNEPVRYLAEIVTEIGIAKVLSAIKLFLQGAQGLNARTEIGQFLSVGLRRQGALGHPDKPDHDLKVVMKAVVEFLQQEIPVAFQLIVPPPTLERDLDAAHQTFELVDALDDIIVEAGLHRADREFFVAGTREHHRAAAWTGALHLLEHLQPVRPVKIKVGDEHVHRGSKGRIQGYLVNDLDWFQIGELTPDGSQGESSHIWVIIDKEESHLTRSTQSLTGSRRGFASLPTWIGSATGLALSLVCLGLCALGLNFLFRNITETRSLAIETAELLRGLSELRAQVRTAETGQRGYILTGDQRYLTPYNAATARIWAVFTEVSNKLDDTTQRQRIDRLHALIEAKLAELSETVALRSQGFEKAVAVVRTDVGQRYMDEIEAGIAEIQRREQANYDTQTERLRTQAERVASAVTLTSMLAVIAAVLGFRTLAQYRSQQALLSAERRFRASLEGRVLERTKELEEVNRELDSFAYMVGHDLSAPARAIHGYAQALEEDVGAGLAAEHRNFITRIKAAALRMDQLIRDLFALSHLSREKITVEAISLDDLLAHLVTRLSPIIAERRAKVEIAENLGFARGHEPSLIQALENLLTNAMKFVRPGQVPIVKVFTTREDDRVRINIRDEGIGIPQDDLNRIFRAFERLHGAETYSGTGIGLAIVHRAVERMGGRVGVSSTPGLGSCFWVELPRADG